MSSLPVFQTILIAEDSSDTRVMLRRALEIKGYNVAEAADGLEAFDEVKSKQPNLVVIDLNMPGLDGLETIKRIRKLSGELGRVPIVVITAFDVYGMEDAAMKLGSDRYLTKPIDLDDFDRALRSLGFLA